MTTSLSTLIRQTKDIIDYDSAVPVTELTLAELNSKPVVAFFGNADMVARIQRKVSIRVTPLDISAQPLEFSEEEVEIMGPNFEDVVLYFVQSEARQARFREVMNRLLLWIEQGKSVESFLQTLD